jgi:AbrB family looped-hinge helix DNA binding protein
MAFNDISINNDILSKRAIQTRLNENGRIVIPAAIRRKLDLKPGDVLLLRVEDDRLIAETQHARIRRVQESLRRLIPADRSLSDELIQDRSEEVENERGEWLG